MVDMNKYLPYTKKYPITLNMLDAYDRITPTAILDILQDISIKDVGHGALSFEKMLEKDALWVLTRTRYDFLRYPDDINEDIEVCTWPNQYEKYHCFRNYTIKDKNGNLIIKALFNWAVINVKTRRIMSLSDFYPVDVEYPSEVVIDEPLIALNIDETTLDKEYDFVVTFSHLDHNGHMNNTKYLEELMNAITLERGLYIKSFQANYLREINYKEHIKIKYKIDENYVKAVFFNENTPTTKIMLTLGKDDGANRKKHTDINR